MVITVWLFLCEQLLLKVIIYINLTSKPQKIILDALHWENAQSGFGQKPVRKQRKLSFVCAF